MEIIIKPIVTEKATKLTDKLNRYAFKVNKDANKIQISQAIEKTYNVTVESVNTMNYSGKAKSRFTKSGVIAGRTSDFKKAIVTLKEGDTIVGEVYDVSESQALVTAKGMDCFIKAHSCSWNTVFSCHEYLNVGEEHEFLILRIDNIYSSIELTMKMKENDPWKNNKVPELSEEVNVRLLSKRNHHIIGSTDNNIEVNIPIEELSWRELSNNQIDEYLNKVYVAKIIERNPDNRLLKASIRLMIDDPWPIIHKNYPKGKEVNGKVIEVNENFIRLDIGNGISGIIPKESMQAAGFEYSDYKKNVVIGQGFDVVVSKVFLEKRRIRFELKRNL